MVQATDEDYGTQKPNLPQALRLIDEMNDSVKQVTSLVESMLQRVKNGELSTEYGLSFLEVKYHMLLNYLINLTYVVLRKCSGQRIENDPSIDRLIEIRTVLEKIRPIDYKLRYQIDKLVKTAVTGTANPSDPLNFKANPGSMMSQLGAASDEEEEESSDSDDDEDEMSKKKRKKKSKDDGGGSEDEVVGKYVPPKITSMPYDADETAAEKQDKLRERARKRALNSALIEEMKEDLLDTPVEISGGSRAQQIISKEMKERERYEEDNFTRLPMTKADKHRQKRLSTMGMLGDELTSFSGMDRGKGSKRKGAKGKKKGGKKRKFH